MGSTHQIHRVSGLSHGIIQIVQANLFITDLFQ